MPRSWARDLGIDSPTRGEGPSEIDIDLQREEWMQRIHPEDVEPCRKDLSALLEGVISALDRFHRVRQSDGRYRWVHIRLRVRCDPGGSPVLLDGSVQHVGGG